MVQRHAASDYLVTLWPASENAMQEHLTVVLNVGARYDYQGTAESATHALQ